MSRFDGKVAAVTGAGSGIGRALAQGLATRGARLALSDVDEAGLKQTLASLPAGPDHRGYVVDVSRREAVYRHADEVIHDFGTAHLVFNNAGATIVGTIAHLSIEEIEWQLAINLWGVVYGTKAFLPVMLEQREGCIVNISSVFGMVGFPAQGPYNISKFGVRGLTECLWAELEGTGVEAVCVHPGGIRTNIERSGRRCSAADADEATFAGLAEKLLLTPPEDCARAILDGVERRRRRIVTGHKARTLWWLSRLLPNSYPSVLWRLARQASSAGRAA
jgi:NAD(P)-dependent dehydrogenase (short-subunit alcohol dehydrogenase family)